MILTARYFSDRLFLDPGNSFLSLPYTPCLDLSFLFFGVGAANLFLLG